MKLKKIASLMLAGVMAVSMLAGCSTKSNEEENGGTTEVKPTTSDAVTVMNDADLGIEFDNDSDFDAALAAAAKKAAHSDVKNAKYTITNVSKGDVYNEFAKKLDVDANLVACDNKTSDIFFNTNKDGADKGGHSKTLTGLWLVEANGLSEDAAVGQVANYMKTGLKDQDEYPETVTLTDGKTYAATYTGSVSIVTVNAADEGKTASAYYIAVSVTQSIARDTIVTK